MTQTSFVITTAIVFVVYITLCHAECPLYEGSCHWTNVAVGQMTEQSCMYGGLASRRADDGDTRQTRASGSCSHTGIDENNAWWYVDLGQPYTIKYVVIHRLDNVESSGSESTFDGFKLYIGNSSDIETINRNAECYQDEVDNKSHSVFRKACNTKGRYVIVYNTNINFEYDDDSGGILDGGSGSDILEGGSGDILELCKVETYVCNSAYYGNHCEHFCGNCVSGNCDPDTGACLNGCRRGWKGKRCQTETTSTVAGDIGAIVGGCVAAVLGIGVAVIIAFVWWRTRIAIATRNGTSSQQPSSLPVCTTGPGNYADLMARDVEGQNDNPYDDLNMACRADADNKATAKTNTTRKREESESPEVTSGADLSTAIGDTEHEYVGLSTAIGDTEHEYAGLSTAIGDTYYENAGLSTAIGDTEYENVGLSTAIGDTEHEYAGIEFVSSYDALIKPSEQETASHEDNDYVNTVVYYPST